MQALRFNTKAVMDARGKGRGGRGSVAALYNEMNLLDGRILHELRPSA